MDNIKTYEIFTARNGELFRTVKGTEMTSDGSGTTIYMRADVVFVDPSRSYIAIQKQEPRDEETSE